MSSTRSILSPILSHNARRLPCVLETCAVCLSLVLAACSVPGTGVQTTPALLKALEVTVGDSSMYPAFDGGVLHYAVRCDDGTTLQVTAQAEAEDATLRLLHDDGSTATGTVQESVTVNSDHDVAIEVSDGGSTATYVVHCIPPEFPDVVIDRRTEAVSDGLLLMTPGVRKSDKSFLAIIDNNGVPRWVMEPNVRARNFRRYPDGRYSFSERGTDGNEPTVILNAGFERIGTATLAGDLLPEHTGGHDFLITENGNYLMMSYYPTPRDFSEFECDGAPCEVDPDALDTDSIVQEVTPDGNLVLEWNSWDHVKIADCKVHRFPRDYAHLNSLHELDGDIVAGLRGCNQVLRLERATGAVVWQMGGSPEMRIDRPAPATGAARYLPLHGDPRGEFCGQHHVTATPAGSVLMFDNGSDCHGARKGQRITRVVEYDISSGTEARFVREYRLPEADGFAASGGGVTALANGNWLITWGNNVRGPDRQPLPAPVAVSEVDTAGNEIFRMKMSKEGERYGTSRVYRERESDLSIPLNLP